MKFVSAELSCVSLPFVEKFSHSLGSRTASESIFVAVTTDDGVTGWGEGMPRTYVTGEDFDSCLQHGQDVLWPGLKGLDLAAGLALTDVLAQLDVALPSHSAGGAIAHNAVRCAFELAAVDAWLRSEKRSLTDALPRTRDEVAYSAVIPTGSIAAAESHARQWKLLGFEHVKVKIDGRDDRQRLDAVRAAFGPEASLRVDGNAAYSLDDALTCLDSLGDLRIACAEQMLARGDLADWVTLTARASVPVMVDESLVTEDDARRLIDHKACSAFNVRLSKCGGLSPTLRIVARAREAGLGFQIGCHVGESALLSAVGRHVACHLADARFLEGSFGSLLLKEDVSRETVRFGHRGRARFIAGPGLGVEIRPEIVSRHAARALKLG